GGGDLGPTATAPRALPGQAGCAAVVLLARPGPLPVRLGGQVDLRRSAGAAGVRPRRPRRVDDLLEPCGAPDGLRRHRTVAAGASGDRGRRRHARGAVLAPGVSGTRCRTGPGSL